MTPARIPVVFFGSGAFGLPTLEMLAREHEVVGIVTRPDRPAGRAQKLTPTPIGEWVAKMLPGAPLLKPEKVNDDAVVAGVRALPAAAFIVIAFGQKLSPLLLDGRFAINLHASLLPRWRGAAPINHAVLAGDARTGNSVITLASTMDAGLILGQSSREIDPAMTAGELHDRLSADGPDLVKRVLARRATGELTSTVQDAAKVTVAPKLSKGDAWVDFSQGAEECRRRINGLSPWPGVLVQFRDAPLKLIRAKAASVDPAPEGVKPTPGTAGTQGSIADPLRGIVRCAAGSALEVLEVQPAGARVMAWGDFARGKRVNADELLIGGSA